MFCDRHTLQRIEAKLDALQSSMNQILQGESKIMGSLAQLQQADTLIGQAVQALGTEEAADVDAINKAITLIQGLQSSGGITDAQAAPVIANLQTQATNIQNAITALSAARSQLSTTGQPGPAPSPSPAPAA